MKCSPSKQTDFDTLSAHIDEGEWKTSLEQPKLTRNLLNLWTKQGGKTKKSPNPVNKKRCKQVNQQVEKENIIQTRTKLMYKKTRIQTRTELMYIQIPGYERCKSIWWRGVENVQALPI